MTRLRTVGRGVGSGIILHRNIGTAHMIINVTAYNVTTNTEPILDTFIRRIGTLNLVSAMAMSRANYVNLYRFRPVIRIFRTNGRGIACMGISTRGTGHVTGRRLGNNGIIGRCAVNTGRWGLVKNGGRSSYAYLGL